MSSIKVPPLGESIVEATISRWLKNEGDAVAPGESLVELETDKITVDVPAMSNGVLKKRLKAEGDVVHVDEVLCEIEEGAVGTVSPAPPAAKPVEAQPKTADAAKATATSQPPGDARVSPAAARMAAERGIDAGSVSGTGRGGVVSKADVIAAAESKPATAPSKVQPNAPAKEQAAVPNAAIPSPSPSPSPSSAPATIGERETREKLSTRRKRIAEHLLESQHATAHLTTFNEIDMTAVNSLRERHKDRVEKEFGVKLSLTPFFVRAACTALKTYPVVNAQLDGDSVIYKHYVNMGIAVASEAGLVVPNVKDADRKGMIDIAKDIALVAQRARDGKLTMDDLTGGTFTITNGGVFGSLVSTPIINYPQVGILGLHKTQDRPVAIAGKVEIRPMMYVALSYDHRIIDGQHAVLFLVKVKELIEDPAAMLIG
jgi:2-oxoglutarate dehydrogenase E2 component (dihydrolipoamide succinyltransferase)